MDFLKSQTAKIREQLAGLSSSQKMLVGSLAVIMVMTLLWWSRYAGSSEMAPLLEQDFAGDDMTRMTAQIESRGIPYKVVGNRLHVAADRRFEVLAMLTYAGLMPQDVSSGWEETIQKMDSPWSPPEKQALVFNRAKEVSLSQVIRQFPNVRSAMVMIDATAKRAFENSIQSTATVTIISKNPGEKAPKKLIDAAADTVAGAVSGLARERVKVIIDGASYQVQEHGANSFQATTYMEALKEAERYYSEKIMSHLRQIDGVMVSVSVNPNLTSHREEIENFNKKEAFDKVLESTNTTENTTSSKPATEPGTTANTGANLTANVAAGDSTSSTITKETTKSKPFVPTTRQWTQTPAGATPVTGASISVPRSHFVKAFRVAYPGDKEPSPDALDPFIKAKLDAIKDQVIGCVNQTPADKVIVRSYYDYLPATGTSAPVAASSLPLALTSHAKEIALGALAVVSLFMVMSMVKKGAPTPIAPPAPVERKPSGPIDASEELAGEAGQGQQSMDAMEIGDEDVRTNQMIAQVQTMVKEDPDAAAGLVKRWLSRT